MFAGIPKLEDANDAGTKNSIDCTLILTEGDSAKALAVSGLGVVGRDRYGVFPLRGKLLNVREATTKQVCAANQVMFFYAKMYFQSLFTHSSSASYQSILLNSFDHCQNIFFMN